ncbi:MAG: DNA-processing protein DprA [Porphyromonadaceae bacterium]|nr:DNA-processing protein DprA [Porphyromonadaceae bacterium]
MTQVYQIALSRAKHIGPHHAKVLLERMGGVEEIFADRAALQARCPKLRQSIVDDLYRPSLIDEAKRIADWCARQDIHTYFIEERDYPKRLAACADAPTLLYCKGSYTDWETTTAISVVGTRNMTTYGQTCCERLLGELAELFPQTLVVSGLAYGVDSLAHRRALALDMPTVAVLAHGFDRIYPAVHTQLANEMLSRGAWVSEYPLGTKPDRFNFVGRNRIIAGLTDATLVIEAGLKSGSLITAELAADYDREVLAVPGRLTDRYSEGCNQLISSMRGVLVTSGEDIVQALGWERRGQAVQQKLLFADEPPIDHPLLRLIAEHQPIHLNDLIRQSGLPASEVNSQLFDLELDAHIRVMPGGLYTLAR